MERFSQSNLWEFAKIGVPYFGVIIIRILPFRVLYWRPLLSETPLQTPGRALSFKPFETVNLKPEAVNRSLNHMPEAIKLYMKEEGT